MFPTSISPLLYSFGTANYSWRQSRSDLFVCVGCCRVAEVVCDYDGDKQRYSKSAVKCKKKEKEGGEPIDGTNSAE